MAAAQVERMPEPGRTAASPPARALRLVPPRATAPTRRDAAYAVALALVLTVGTLGVLALNTLMQQQARTLAAQQGTLSALALRQQTLQLALDAADNPHALARRAAALHMRPATILEPLRPATAKSVSARGRGKKPTRAG